MTKVRVLSRPVCLVLCLHPKAQEWRRQPALQGSGEETVREEQGAMSKRKLWALRNPPRGCPLPSSPAEAHGSACTAVLEDQNKGLKANSESAESKGERP